MGNHSQEEYDRVSNEYEELLEEYWAEQDKLFWNYQDRLKQAKEEN